MLKIVYVLGKYTYTLAKGISNYESGESNVQYYSCANELEVKLGRIKMKKIISFILSMVLAISVLCINVFAEAPTQCPLCDSTGPFTAICSGVNSHQDLIDCNVRNSTVLGVLHYGNCTITRYYNKTQYLCNSCHNTFNSSDSHMCYVVHSSTSVGVYTRSVCSTYLNRAFVSSFLPITAECSDGCEHFDLLLSGVLN